MRILFAALAASSTALACAASPPAAPPPAVQPAAPVVQDTRCAATERILGACRNDSAHSCTEYSVVDITGREPERCQLSGGTYAEGARCPSNPTSCCVTGGRTCYYAGHEAKTLASAKDLCAPEHWCQ